jgi:hypothetical protein
MLISKVNFILCENLKVLVLNLILNSSSVVQGWEGETNVCHRGLIEEG